MSNIQIFISFNQLMETTENAKFIAEIGKPDPKDEDSAKSMMGNINADEKEMINFDNELNKLSQKIESMLQSRDVLEKEYDIEYKNKQLRFIHATDQLRMMGIATISSYFDEPFNRQFVSDEETKPE